MQQGGEAVGLKAEHREPITLCTFAENVPTVPLHIQPYPVPKQGKANVLRMNRYIYHIANGIG